MNFDRTPASVLILGAILVMSALALWVAPALLDRNLLRPYWLIRRRQYDTIVTSGFIHGVFGHLLFNSLTFFFFAPALERRIGAPKFFALYFMGLWSAASARSANSATIPTTPRSRIRRHSCGAVRVHRLFRSRYLPVLRAAIPAVLFALAMSRTAGGRRRTGTTTSTMPILMAPSSAWCSSASPTTKPGSERSACSSARTTNS